MFRVLEVVPALAAGGIENLLCNYFLDNQVFKDFEIEFITHAQNGITKDRLEAAGFKVYYVPPKQSSFLTWYKTMKKIIFSGNYDIVHAHQSLKSFFTVYIAKKTGVKVRIIHAHTNTSRIDSPVTKLLNVILRLLCNKCSTHYFSCSNEAATYLFGNKKLKETFIMPNAVDASKFTLEINDKYKMREKLNNPSHVVIHVGRFTKEKNHDFIIDLVGKVTAVMKNVIFVFLGDGPEKDRIEAIVNNKNLNTACFFMGNVDNVQDYLSVSDVQILPSIFEGFPVSAIEAQFMGLPILLSDTITREVRISEYATFLPNDIDVWSEKIINLLNNNYEKKRDDKLIEKSQYNISNARYLLKNKYLSCLGAE